MPSTRREFLQHSLGSATLLASGLTIPGFLRRTALAATPRRDGRVLVLVQLSGGNDGLNTVVPYADDRYHRARPTLGIAPERTLKLAGGLGLHPDLTGLKRLFDDGLLGVVTNVGYPNPDRSHFRSLDIWHTASLQPETARDGWLGRVVDRAGAAGGAPPALHLDHEPAPLALRTQHVAVPSIAGLDALQLDDGAALARTIRAAAPIGDSGEPAAALDDLLFVQRTALSSCANAQRIQDLPARGPTTVTYPGYGLATRLAQIARLIRADFGARIFFTSLGGFDTHARQALAHGPLLRELAESAAAFFDDLRGDRLADRVILMTFSEFGRRLAENGSQGTDHGAAAPLFVAGGACRGGIIGGPPDLAALDDGDVRHTVDFRSVYASLLADWLDVPAHAVLGEHFEPLAVFRR